MLADNPDMSSRTGSLARHVHRPQSFRYELIDFISGELPRWRNRSDLRKGASETGLTSQLCGHLNSAARLSDGWDILQFRVEEPDEKHKGRKIDLVPAPCGVTLWIDGRGYADFDALMPIECKRLPTPVEGDRDEREYAFSTSSSTGGIQRFKTGHHGASHVVAGMIGYVQEQTVAEWDQRIAEWITGLAGAAVGWSEEDLLKLEHYSKTLRLGKLRSSHRRKKDLPDIEIRHLWIEMN